MYKTIGEKLVKELMVNHEIEPQNIIENYSNVALKRAAKICKSDSKRLRESQNIEFDEEIEDTISKLQKCSKLINKEILKRNNKENGSLTPKVAAKHELERAIKLANKAEREEIEEIPPLENFEIGKLYEILTYDELLKLKGVESIYEDTLMMKKANIDIEAYVREMDDITDKIIFPTNKHLHLREGWTIQPWMCRKIEGITIKEAAKLKKISGEFKKPTKEYVSTDLEPVELEEKRTSTVNHPQHYNVGPIETIDVIESLDWGKGFNLGNALKYLMRCEHKGKKKEDLEKAMWYIKRELKNIKEER